MHTLPKLPYDYGALEPHIDAVTMEIHHTKHHATYISNVNKALEGHPKLTGKPVEQLLREISAVPEDIRQTVVPPAVEQRLSKSIEGLPKPGRPWWKRLMGE